MKRTRIIIIFFLFVFMGFSCGTHPSVTVKHVTYLEAGHSRQGFYYALPRTVISVDVTVVKTEQIPGPFAQYAGTLLSLDNVITSPSTQYFIDQISINPFSEPDPAEFYFVEYDPEKFRKNPFSLSLSEAGLISAVNSEFDHEKFIRSAPGGNVHGFFGSEATFNHFMETRLQEKIDTILEQVRMDTVTIERKKLRRTWVEKTSEVRAREVADYILGLRSKRFDLLTGFAEITYSKEAIQYMNEQLLQMENNYLELFTGITTQTATRYRYYYVPEKNTEAEPQLLFYFNEQDGVLDEQDAVSQPVELIVARDFSSRQMGVFTMNPSGNKPVDRGIFYRIPEHGKVSLVLDGAPIADARILISQYGIITSLPPDDFKIEFYPNNGSLKSVEKIE